MQIQRMIPRVVAKQGKTRKTSLKMLTAHQELAQAPDNKNANTVLFIMFLSIHNLFKMSPLRDWPLSGACGCRLLASPSRMVTWITINLIAGLVPEGEGGVKLSFITFYSAHEFYRSLG